MNQFENLKMKYCYDSNRLGIFLFGYQILIKEEFSGKTIFKFSNFQIR